MMNQEQVIAYANGKGFREASKVAPLYAVSVPAGVELRVQTREGLESLTTTAPTSLCRGLHNRDLWLQLVSKVEKNYDAQGEVSEDDSGQRIEIAYEEAGNPKTITFGIRKYLPKPNTRLVCQIPEEFEVKTSWSKDPLKGKAGDFLVKAGDTDYYPLGKDEFDATYKYR